VSGVGPVLPSSSSARKVTLITGGAGFIGVNLAARLAAAGRRVLVYDSLSRPGVEHNLHWLCQEHGELVQVEIDDICHAKSLRKLVKEAEEVFHCAGQVAVTTSIETPGEDFEVNARGTLNLLEALRSCLEPPPLLFTSTNKVYGSLSGLDLEAKESALMPVDPGVRRKGIAENQPLDFYSPYGCSKGAADQYVLDYARIYRMPTVVFRMSCIYGPHQLGTEDQGWVAHFLIRSLKKEPITIYGSGKQVRDILFIDDLLDAFQAAMAQIHKTRGRAFNIGGGPGNCVSLLEFIKIIEELHGTVPEIDFGPVRPGDQLYYVSNTSSFREATGWQPLTAMDKGLGRLYQYLSEREKRAVGIQEPEAVML
jgi:CDP-paratose 2-epimerase